MALVLTWPVGRASDATGRYRPPFAPVAVYWLTSALSGALTALALVSAVAFLRRTSAAAAVTVAVLASGVAVVATGCEWRGSVRPLPDRRRQVPRRWLMWKHKTLTAAAFGLMIGSGVLTHLKHAAAYVLAAIIVMAPAVYLGVLIGAVYGASRGATLVAIWVSDRVLGRRLQFKPFAAGESPMLNRLLATIAFASFIVALLIS
jgi:hypothetical protein